MADTLRVDECYRPLRIGWAIRQGDSVAIRQAMRYSHALWGGRFNPILVVDREEEARPALRRSRVEVRPNGRTATTLSDRIDELDF